MVARLKLGRSLVHTFERIAYIGLQDFRYWVIELAGQKTGHPVLLFSPRNAIVNNVSLFNSCGCKTIIYSEGFETLIEKHKAVLPSLTAIQLATSDEVFNVHNSRKQANSNTVSLVIVFRRSFLKYTSTSYCKG